MSSLYCCDNEGDALSFGISEEVAVGKKNALRENAFERGGMTGDGVNEEQALAHQDADNGSRVVRLQKYYSQHRIC